MASNYAMYHGKQIKVGRHGLMFYLRWDQRNMVDALPGQLAPSQMLEHIWFRVPRLSEDKIEPGAFPFEGWCGAKPIRFHVKIDPDGDMSYFERNLMSTMRENLGAVETHDDVVGINVTIPCAHGYEVPSLPNCMHYSDMNISTLGVAAIGIRNGRPAVLLGCMACRLLICKYYSVEDLEDNCEPLKGEEQDWAALLKTLHEMETTVKVSQISKSPSYPNIASKNDDGEEDED